MAVKIEGTVRKKSGGGGLGKLLGGLLGGTAGFLVAGPGGALKGASLGSTVGGLAGGAIKKGEQKELGVPVEGAQSSGIAQKQQGPSAIDRAANVMDTGLNLGSEIEGLSSLQAGTNLPQTDKSGMNAINRKLLSYGYDPTRIG